MDLMQLRTTVVAGIIIASEHVTATYGKLDPKFEFSGRLLRFERIRLHDAALTKSH